MQTYFITANDTDVGKTYACAALARHFARQGLSVQIVKAVDCGGSGDAEWAREFAAEPNISAHTLLKFPAPLAPLADENRSGQASQLDQITQALNALPAADIRLIEGAGGIAVPIDPSGLDWRDFAQRISPSATIVVVDNRLGAINQGRLAHAYLGDLPHAFLLNQIKPAPEAVLISNREAYAAAGMTILATLQPGTSELAELQPNLLQLDSENEASTSPTAPGHPQDSDISTDNPTADTDHFKQLQGALAQRRAKHAFRETKVRHSDEAYLNLADNDYLDLSRHPEMIAAGKAALDQWGTSSSASPLITGYTAAHQALESCLSAWYGDKAALVWNSGYAANQSVLKLFLEAGDLVIADRLIHNSLIAGILQSGARLIRFRHNDLDHLETLLRKHSGSRTIHLVTESVYSMDGDYPDIQRIAELKNQYAFKWFLDEAHAVGWYGRQGAGLAEHYGILDSVDILTGTLGKALASSGAFTIFKEAWMRDYCVNEGNEFIYSTYLPPSSAAVASTAIGLIQGSQQERQAAQAHAVAFREGLRLQGWDVLGSDSPIVPVICGDSESTLNIASDLLAEGLKVGAIRPPTVPQGAARLRISLKSTLTDTDYEKLAGCFERSRLAHV